MQYRIGTISVTNGSNVVNGVGTTWLANVLVNQVGRPNPTLLVNGGSVVYTIAAVNSNTQLLLSVPYAGTTASGLNYSITKDFTPNLGLAEINEGDRDWGVHLTEEVIRKLDIAVATGGGSVDVSGKEDKTNKSTDVNFTDNSDVKYPTQRATKTYIDKKSTLGVALWSDLHYKVEAGPLVIESALAEILDGTIPVNIIISGGDNAFSLNAEPTSELDWGVWRKANISDAGLLYQSAPGNHDFEGADDKETLYSNWGIANGPGASRAGNFGTSNVFQWNDLVIITLGRELEFDSTLIPSNKALDWLEAQLLTYHGHKIIVVSHEPIIDCGLNSSYWGITEPSASASNSARMKSICAANKILAWFHGHLHYIPTGGDPHDLLVSTPSGFGGTTFFGIPSTKQTGGWFYFSTKIGDSTITVKCRDSINGEWVSTWEATLTLPSPIKPAEKLNTAHSHLMTERYTAPTYFVDLTVEDKNPTINLENSTSTAARVPRVTLTNYRGATGAGNPRYTMQNANGSRTVPSALVTGTLIGQHRWNGHDGVSMANAGFFNLYAEDNFSSTDHKSYFTWDLTQDGSTPTEKMRLSSDGTLEAVAFVGNGEGLTGIVTISGGVGEVTFSNGSGGLSSDSALNYTNGTLTLAKSGAHVNSYRLWVTDDSGSAVAKIYHDGTGTFTNLKTSTVYATGYQLNGVSLLGYGANQVPQLNASSQLLALPIYAATTAGHTTLTGATNVVPARIERTTGSANSGAAALYMSMKTSVNGTDGLGAAIQWVITDDTATDKALGTLGFVRAGADDQGDCVIRPATAGVGAEKFRVVSDGRLRVTGMPTAPASAGATGTAGDIIIDSSYIYVCTATNTWKRSALSTW